MDDQAQKMRAKGRKHRWFVRIVLVVSIVAVIYVRWHSMPAVAWRALNDADRYELLSIEPDRTEFDPARSESGFYFHRILGRTVITDPAVRNRLNRALEAGVRQGANPAACFNPRHGIRVSSNGETTDFLICFECSQVAVRRGDRTVANFLTSNAPQVEFDQVLRAAGIPLAREKP